MGFEGHFKGLNMIFLRLDVEVHFKGLDMSFVEYIVKDFHGVYKHFLIF